MPTAIKEGKAPAIRVFQRTWNDENVGARIRMQPPKKVIRANKNASAIEFSGTFHRPDILCAGDVQWLHGGCLKHFQV